MTRAGAWRRGSTMLELLIATGLMTVVGTMLIQFLMRQIDFVETTSAQGDIRSRSHLAVGIVAKELRAGTRKAAGSPPNVVIPAASNNTTLTLYVPEDLNADGTIVDGAGNIEWSPNSVVFQYDAGNQQLLRTSGGTTRVVVSHVTAATFADSAIDPALPADEVRVSLTLAETTPQRRTVTTSASQVVRLRN